MTSRLYTGHTWKIRWIGCKRMSRADKASGTWGMNSELTGWKFEGCRDESKARVRYWRCVRETQDMIIIETEDHFWILRSPGEILSDFVSYTNYEEDERLFIHKVPNTLTVEALMTVNRFVSLQTMYPTCLQGAC